MKALLGFFQILLLVIVVAGASVVATLYWTKWRLPPEPEVSFKPTVQALEQLSQIVSLRIHLADTLTVDAKKGRHTVQAAWIIKGDALIAVDLKQGRVIDVSESNKTATIQLPPPSVLSPRIDHEKTKTFNLERGLWTKDEYVTYINDKAMKLAQQKIREQASSPEYIEMGRTLAERIIRGFYSLADWEVEVAWRDSTNNTDAANKGVVLTGNPLRGLPAAHP
jgi:hypothetical protein